MSLFCQNQPYSYGFVFVIGSVSGSVINGNIFL